VAQAEDRLMPGAAFTEGHVEADGFRIRYMEAGRGALLVHLHGARGLLLTPAHDLLSRQFRVIVFEMPGFGQSPENTRTRTMPELAATMAKAAEKLGIDSFNLMGTSYGARTALWLAVQQPERLLALVLESPAAMLPEDAAPPSGSPHEIPLRRLHAHPKRLPPAPPPDPAIWAKTRPLVMRLRGPIAIQISSVS
jgi:pimeloyl-ACP methyl ester carboxylesterase